MKISLLIVSSVLFTNFAFAALCGQDKITVIVPAGPGASGDFLARLISEKMSKQSGATLIVDNRPGASGNIGV